MSDSTKTQSVCKWCTQVIRLTTTVDIPEFVVSPDGAIFCPKFGKPTGHKPVAEPASTGEPMCRDYFNGLSERLLNADYTAAYIAAARRESEDVLIQALRDISIVWAARPTPKEVAEQSGEPEHVVMACSFIGSNVEEATAHQFKPATPQPVAGNVPKVEISTLFEEFRKRFNQFSNYIPEENRNRYLIPLLDRLQELLREADRIG